MRNVNKINFLNQDDEISSLVYACVASADYVESKTGSLYNYNPINFIIDSLYDLDFEVYPHLNIVPDRGGARYLMNDVSSYRFSKGHKIRHLNQLQKLFERYDCKDKEDIKKFINLVYENRFDYKSFDETITKALYAYKTYYLNNVSIESWPKDIKLFRDFFVNMVKKSDESFTDVSINSQSSSIHSLDITHLVYPEVKMLVLTDGIGNPYEYNASYKFIDYMNEWFNKTNPYDEGYAHKLEKIVSDLDNKLSKDMTSTSASVVIIVGKNTYVISAGNTRVHLIYDGNVTSIKRKENLYDEIKEKNMILPCSEEYAKSIPVGTVGYNADKFDKYNSEVYVIPTSMFDGLFITTSDIHENISDSDLSATINNNDSDEVLRTLEEIYELYKTSNGIMLYEKEKRISKKFRR